MGCSYCKSLELTCEELTAEVEELRDRISALNGELSASYDERNRTESQIDRLRSVMLGLGITFPDGEAVVDAAVEVLGEILDRDLTPAEEN